LTEVFLGRVAGPEIGRMALRGDAFNTGFGYAVYLTSNRIVGLSYTRLLSRSYYPAYFVCLSFAALLTAAVVYARAEGISGNQQIPLGIIIVPIIWALAVISMVLLYLRPKQVGNQIRREAPTALLDLANQSPDLVLERNNISHVSVDGYRINILTKSNQWYCFMIKVAPRLYSKPMKWKGQSRQLFDLFQRFCSTDPPISMFFKQGRQWVTLPQAQGS
jgi:hypothetical protein